MLVLIAVVIAATIGHSYVSTQSTSLSIARNVQNHSRARCVAEAGLELALAHIRSNESWRTDRPHGTWVQDETFGQGTFTIVAEDGEDTDGDGVVGVPAEGDGDLTDDPTELLSLTVKGELNGANHVARAVVTPIPGKAKTVLFVVPNPSNLDAKDQARKTQFESWGYEVALIDQSDSQSTFDAAVAEADVAYITPQVGSSSVNTKLTPAPIGVVSEEGYLNDDLGLTSGSGLEYSGSQIDVVDNSHYITEALETGVLTIVTSSQKLRRTSGSLAPGATVLAERVSSSDGALVVIDAGSTLVDGSAAAGRRVALPWGGDNFSFLSLNGAGLTLAQRSLQWASQPTAPPTPIVHYNFSSQSGSTIADQVRDTDGDGDEDGDDVIVDLCIEPGNGSVAWMTDPQVGNSLYFDQDAQSGTAIARTANKNVADRLKQAMKDSDALTVQAFIKAQGFDNSGGRLVSYSKDTTNNHRNVTLMADNDGASTVDLIGRVKNSGSVNEYKKNNVFELNRFQVLAFTVDHGLNRNNIKLYVDGELVKTSSRSNRNFNSWTSEYFMLANELTLNRPFRGYMYDIKVYDRALSGAQLLRNARELLPAEDENPQLIALYEFNEVITNPVLIHHWKLDENTGEAVSGLAVDDRLDLWNNTRIDSFDSTLGPYGGGNVGSQAVVSTNSTQNNRLRVANNATIQGDAYVGPGGNPSSVIQLSGNGTITGSQSALGTEVSMPALSTPPGMPSSEGSRTLWGTQTLTINTDKHYNKLSLWGSARLIIDGNVTVLIDGNFQIGDDAQLVIESGATLDLYCKKNFSVWSDAQVNVSTAKPSSLRIYMLGNNRKVEMGDDAQVYALAQNPNGRLNVWGSSDFHGTFVGDRFETADSGSVHLDVSEFGGGTLTATDAVGGDHGTYAGPGGGEPGQDGTAVRFDGDDDYVLIPHANSMLLDNGTVAFWFNSDSFSGHRGLFSKDSNGYDTGGHLHVYTDGSRVKARLQSTNQSYYVQSGSGLHSGDWYHVVLTFGVGGVKLYLNGSPVDSDDYTGGLGTSSGGTGNCEPLVLGANTWGSGNLTHTPLSNYFSGLIDDVQVYDYPLDAGQVGNLYNGNPIGDPTGPGATVVDTSGFGLPLDLTIEDPENVSWIPGGGLEITDGTKVVSGGAATKLYDALTGTSEMTLEVIFTPANLTQDGPARIASYSQNTSNRNFTLGQEDEKYIQRLRTTSTNSNGMPDVESSNVLTTDSLHHVVVTYDGENVRMYRNGALEVTYERDGTFNWSSSYRFMLANEETNNRHWLGSLYRVAIYDRALVDVQVDDLFGGNPPRELSDSSFTYAVRWLSSP